MLPTHLHLVARLRMTGVTTSTRTCLCDIYKEAFTLPFHLPAFVRQLKALKRRYIYTELDGGM
jgi:hypothetical protein